MKDITMFEKNKTAATCVLELDSQRNVISGSRSDLAGALDRGADLLIGTGFYYNEHIRPGHVNGELVDEVSDFRVVYRIGEEWSAGIMNLRMPVEPALGFGPRESWSYFMYNCDGSQAIARPFLDGKNLVPPTGESDFTQPADMPKYHIINRFDAGTNAPSENFIYDFEYYRFMVRDQWQEIYSHDEYGNTLSGSPETLADVALHGGELKAAIRNFQHQDGAPDYELFTFLGSTYHHLDTGLFSVNSQPVVLVDVAEPMRYASGNWSFGNMLLQNDGVVWFWSCDPYSMKYTKKSDRCAIRYFTRQ